MCVSSVAESMTMCSAFCIGMELVVQLHNAMQFPNSWSTFSTSGWSLAVLVVYPLLSDTLTLALQYRYEMLTP